MCLFINTKLIVQRRAVYDPRSFFIYRKAEGKKVQKKEKLCLKKTRQLPTYVRTRPRLHHTEVFTLLKWLLSWPDGDKVRAEHTACCRWRLTLVNNIFKSVFSSKNNILQPSVTVCVLYGLESEEFTRLSVSSYNLIINSINAVFISKVSHAQGNANMTLSGILCLVLITISLNSA